MVVGLLQVELWIPENSSLKGKRQVLKSIISKLRNNFNVSAAEVGEQETWQRAVLGVACVSSSREYVHSTLMKVVNSIDSWRLDAEVVDYQIEIM